MNNIEQNINVRSDLSFLENEALPARFQRRRPLPAQRRTAPAHQPGGGVPLRRLEARLAAAAAFAGGRSEVRVAVAVVVGVAEGVGEVGAVAVGEAAVVEGLCLADRVEAAAEHAPTDLWNDTVEHFVSLFCSIKIKTNSFIDCKISD